LYWNNQHKKTGNTDRLFPKEFAPHSRFSWDDLHT
jgi:hypothetical protein